MYFKALSFITEGRMWAVESDKSGFILGDLPWGIIVNCTNSSALTCNRDNDGDDSNVSSQGGPWWRLLSFPFPLPPSLQPIILLGPALLPKLRTEAGSSLVLFVFEIELAPFSALCKYYVIFEKAYIASFFFTSLLLSSPLFKTWNTISSPL